MRDAIDTRVLKEVAAGTASCGEQGIIDRQSEAGGWPLLRSTPAPADEDGDGMPDAWEQEHGLDPKDPADRNGHRMDALYSNLESYLNEMVSRQAVRIQR